jgi:cytochrome c oxidase subunit II
MKAMKSIISGLLISSALVAFTLISMRGYLVAAENERVIQITAKKFEYSPKEITLKKGVPVVLEFTSLDRLHGFNCPGLGIHIDIRPGKVNRLQFVPDKVGTFPFHCDNFCGSGHEGMRGMIAVTE